MKFLWKMAHILSKGILSVCNDIDCSCFMRDRAANFASNSCLIGVEMKERIQVPALLLK